MLSLPTVKDNLIRYIGCDSIKEVSSNEKGWSRNACMYLKVP